MKKFSLTQALHRVWSSPIRLLAASVFFAGILLGEVNWLASQHFARSDLSQTARYSLSPPTLALLRGQSTEIELSITLAPSDPLFDPLRHLIDTYRAATPLITSKRIDPGRDPLAFQAATGGSAPGDLVLLAQRGEKRIFVTRDKFVRTNEEQARRSMEQTISNAIADALEDLQIRVCFPTGHGEPSIDDVGPEGLAPLRDHMKRLGFSASRVPLDVPTPEAALKDCAVVLVAAPERPYPRQHVRALIQAGQRGADLLLVLPPIVDTTGEIISSGLEDLLTEYGLGLERGFLIEGDPSRRLPEGMGEIFYVDPEVHRVTDGLSRADERNDARPLVVTAGSIALIDPSRAHALLQTSPEATLLHTLGAPSENGPKGRQIVGAAAEASPGDPSSRLVLFSFSNLLYAASDQSMVANRILLENALDWLADRKPKLALPPAQVEGAELILTEESLSAVLRYVLIYIPLSTAALGAFVLLRRRRRERELAA